MRGNTFCIQRGLELFVHDAFMGGMHVHNNQAMRVLREDIDAGELGESEAQGKVRGVFAW